jgi:hypothetical protein
VRQPIKPRSQTHTQTASIALPARRYAAYIPLLGGFGGIALAVAGELLVESGDKTPVSLLLYLAGIAAFAISAWYMPPAAEDLPQDSVQGATSSAAARRRAWVILGGGTVAAVLVNLVAVLMIREQLDSVTGLYLWLLSLLIIGAVGFAARNTLNWPPQWGTGVWPTSRNGRLLLLVAVLIILIVASASRLIALDKVPFGINADEGDRAATSIQIVRGYNTASIFDSGWYFISNFYFWLLAQLMKIIGVGFIQARVFGALASIISVATITWIGIRHFNVRVGLMAGALLSLLAVSMQFARETSEAGPTATLWAVSFALMLEGARTGKVWAWIGAGMAGAFSLYFYPSGRLWVVVAVAFSLYLLVHSLGGRRLDILRGAVLAGVAAFLVAGPFLVHTLPLFGKPGQLDIFSLRAHETSIFVPENPRRLDYYQEDWNIVQLLGAQVDRSVGMFNQYHDDGGFFPTDGPITSGLLTILILLGVGWVSTRWRDPRYVLLALWFWVGLSGVIVTVETPNVQRFATAIPVLALFPALVLDNLARRVEIFLGNRRRVDRAKLAWATSGLAAAVILFLAASQYNFYFNVYGHTDRWPQPTIQGNSVNDQGRNTLVVSLARQFHQVNSGWVRLLAPDIPRGGTRNPGMDLPLSVPADKNLAFMIYPRQIEYLSYLSDLYPGGTTIPYTHTTEGLVVDMYRLPHVQWAATQGAMAQVGQGQAIRVAALGEPPPGLRGFPAEVRWTAGLRVGRYWNYEFRVGAGPARLTIDGQQVLEAGEGEAAQATVSLARGMHYVVYEGTLKSAEQKSRLEWGMQPETDPGTSPGPPEWTIPKTEELYTLMSGRQGLSGVVRVEGEPRPQQLRIDGTLAFCCLTDQLDTRGQPYTAKWTGTLTAPVTGVYTMTMFAQGAVDLKIDDRSVVRSEAASEDLLESSVDLSAGPHQIEVDFAVNGGPGGLEWEWTPPRREKEIVPPSALAPPEGGGIGREMPQDSIGPLKDQPEPAPPLETVP